MSYANKTYVAFDADNDIRYYWLMQAWKKNDNTSFNFYDAHDLNNIRVHTEENIKRNLQERMRSTNVFILLVGDNTKYLYKFVRWEIEQALNRNLPIIVVNINGKRSRNIDLCPSILNGELSVHVSFNQKIIEHAISNWYANHEKLRREGKEGDYHYNDSIYKKFGL